MLMISAIFYKKSWIEKMLIGSCFTYVIITTLLFIVRNFNYEINVGDADSYITNFIKYLEDGAFVSNVRGTTVVYYAVLNFFYNLFGSVKWAFFGLNLISQLIILCLGLFMLFKDKTKNNIFFLVIYLLYSYKVFFAESYSKASNDTFLGVFIMLILYLLIFEIYSKVTIKKRILYLIGVFLAISLGIRPTTVLIIPIVFVILLLHKVNNKTSLFNVFKNSSFILVPFVVITCIIHYPSLTQNKKISFYNKNPEKYNWTQRNFLAIKKIEENNLAFNHGNIWATTFQDVDDYVEKNGKDSLPKTLSEIIINYPLLYLKIVFLNVIYLILWIIRYTGLLFLLPFINLYYSKKSIFRNIPFIVFTVFSLSLLLVVYGKIEYRWYLGYEILIYLSIVFSLKELINKKDKLLNLIFILSLIMVITFNIKSIFNLI